LTYLAALSIESKYVERRVDIPPESAWSSMKLNGMKIPMKNRKDEKVNKLNRVSVKGSQKTRSLKARGLGGRRDLTVRKATDRSARMRKALILIVHPKPTSSIRCVVMIGKITPPSPDPAAIIPKAAPLFLKNQVVMVLVAALKMQLRPRGEHMP
jgi:hypothetical protein